MKSIAIIFVCVGVSYLSGCATVLNGTHQNVIVLTNPVNNARCTLENDRGKWQLDKTPGHVMVHRSDKNLRVTCENKFNKKTISIKSQLSNIVYANIIFGGILGGQMDKINGSAYDYPTEIKLPLKLTT